MKQFLLGLILLLTLAACESATPTPTPTITPPASQEEVQVVEKQPSLPPSQSPATQTATRTPAAQDTLAPSASPVKPSATLIPSATPDLRIIQLTSERFLLQLRDLPPQGRMYLPPNTLGPFRNPAYLTLWGETRGQEYLTATGRLDGYRVAYYRGSEGVWAPEWISCIISRYASVDGARLALSEYNPSVATWQAEGWVTVEDPPQIGETTAALGRKQDPQSDELKLVVYRLEFSYRNYAVVLEAPGRVDEFLRGYVDDAALLVLERLQAAPLVQP